VGPHSCSAVQPDLVILNYGTKRGRFFCAYVGKWYEQELRLAIGRLRRALPNCSLLIMSPMDRAERVAGRRDSHAGPIPSWRLQERIAREPAAASSILFAARAAKAPWRAGTGAAATGLRGFHPHHAQRGPPGG